MKIIAVDNFNREGPGFDNRFLFSIRDERLAEEIVRLMNTEDHGETFFRAVPDNHVLQRFEP